MFERALAFPVITRCLAMSHSHVVETNGVPQLAETRIANDGALYTLAQFESYYKERADWYWQKAAMRRQIDRVPPPATAVAISGASDGVHLASDGCALTAFDEHSIQRKVEEIARALDEALDAEENARTNFPSTACALVGEYGWWLSRGSVGSASSKCSESAVWCRHVVRRWWNHAASRLQRYRRRRRLRILRRGEYCDLCEMIINGPIQYADHIIGKKHIKNERRNTMLPENIVRRNLNRQRLEFLTSAGIVSSSKTMGVLRQ